MRILEVLPEDLSKWNAALDKAVEKAIAATAETKKIEDVGLNHGLYSSESNSAFVSTEAQRRAASAAIGLAIVDLKTKLAAAALAYSTVDEELGENLDKQMLDR